MFEFWYKLKKKKEGTLLQEPLSPGFIGAIVPWTYNLT